MTLRKLEAEQLAANRNLCGAIGAVAGGLAGVAQAAAAPVVIRIVLLSVVAAAALAGLCFHLWERRAVRRNARPVVPTGTVP
ncbi:MAG TPA: hypothetical protein VKB03_09940, partial [Conexibacter sp.]|nr:hypothetical protein [Conexibacter sp.]